MARRPTTSADPWRFPATVSWSEPGDDDGGSWSGSAYVFRTTDGGATYDEVAKLTAADAAASDPFGGSVAIDGGTIVVGAFGDADGGSYSGSVYVFPPRPTAAPRTARWPS